MIFENKTENIEVHKIKSFDFPYHVHHDAEILICTNGTLEASCNKVTKTLHKGDVMFAFPNDIHPYTKTAEGEGIMIIFNPNISELITSLLNNGKYHNFVSGSSMISAANEMYNCHKNSSCDAVIYGYLHIIVGTVLEKSPHLEKPPDIDTFNSAVRYISLNYTEPLTLKSIAKAVGVSRYHLSRMFADKIDGGFKGYLQILRVERAKDLLKNTDLSIYEVSIKSGFSDQRTFNRVFKNIMDTTPREYRKEESRPV